MKIIFVLGQKLRKLDGILSAEECFQSMNRIIIKFLVRFAPEEEIEKSRKNSSEWITIKVKNETIERNLVYKNSIQDPSDIHRKRFTSQRNRVTKSIRNAKRDYNEKFFGRKSIR